MSLRCARTKVLVVGSAGLMMGGLLAGCSGGGATTASESPTASQTPSEAASDPAPAPSETPEWMVNDEDGNPVFPPAGEILPETDVEGAEQAAEDFLRSYFTGLEEQSSQYMREHSSAGCNYCADRVKEIDDVSKKADSVEILGEPVFTNFETLPPQPDQKTHIVIFNLSYPAVLATDPGGAKVDEGAAGANAFAIALAYTANGWRAEEVEVPDAEREEILRSAARFVAEE